ncbi:tripartite tricarboxylate transporter TctB family protein [Caldimonas tepidiphila]|uniref:tripartite tricarboxylate transporter TctB family protein n=1 Tax=Caldimonas tepidiphila TaxID=2315841 RepID=UPI000E5A74BF|nr:tripartite tricarboxylate transporter TctB family protein [Caldimonas tepidiphila]
MKNRGFAAIGAGVLAIAALMALGAAQIGGDAGYGGVGPAFLPWLVSGALAVLGAALIVSALRHAAPLVEAPAFPPRWRAMAWVSLGLLANAALIEHVGFVASCALLFALGARGFRIGQDQTPSRTVTLRDAALGAAISAPVFWIFTKVLGLTLPALTRGGWI